MENYDSDSHSLSTVIKDRVKERVLSTANDPEVRQRALEVGKHIGEDALIGAGLIKVKKNGERKVRKLGVVEAAVRPMRTARRAFMAAGKSGRRELRSASVDIARSAVSSAFDHGDTTSDGTEPTVSLFGDEPTGTELPSLLDDTSTTSESATAVNEPSSLDGRGRGDEQLPSLFDDEPVSTELPPLIDIDPAIANEAPAAGRTSLRERMLSYIATRRNHSDQQASQDTQLW